MNKCPECKGEKVIRKVDIKNARTTIVKCPVCGGSGTTEPKQEGVFIRRVPGWLFYYLYRVEGKDVASMMVNTRPVEEKEKIYSSNKKKARIVAEILRFDVEKKYRKIMPEAYLINSLQSECSHIFIGTNNTTVRTRDILKSCGFAKGKNIWIWKNDSKN